jgi:NADPH2:quinone reductase
MLAQILKAFGGPENFEIPHIPKPAVRAGTVLVRLVVTSDNAIDIKIRTGPPIGPDLPAVPGADVAGIEEGVGTGVLDFRPCDEVYGCDGGVKGPGGVGRMALQHLKAVGNG